MSCITVFGVLLAAVAVTARYIRPDVLPRGRVVRAPSRWVDPSALPAAFDWRDQISVSPMRSQYVPQWCGSCWAMAVTSALADRVMVMRSRQHQLGAPVMLSPQVLLDCGWTDKDVGSCNGGSWELAHQFIAETGITEDSCSPYIAADRGCLHGARMCMTCNSTGSCGPVEGARRFHVDEYGYLNTTTEMQQEILAHGPIVCSMYSHTPSWHCYNGSGVVRDDTKITETTHVISLAGWGTSQDGVDYWIGRHSGGSTWGEEGWFKIERGVNTLGIESHCGFATIKDANPVRNEAEVFCEA